MELSSLWNFLRAIRGERLAKRQFPNEGGKLDPHLLILRVGQLVGVRIRAHHAINGIHGTNSLLTKRWPTFSGPGESSSPMSQVILRCYDFPPRILGHLLVSLPGSTLPSSVRVSQLALAFPEGRRRPSVPDIYQFGRLIVMGRRSA